MLPPVLLAVALALLRLEIEQLRVVLLEVLEELWVLLRERCERPLVLGALFLVPLAVALFLPFLAVGISVPGRVSAAVLVLRLVRARAWQELARQQSLSRAHRHAPHHCAALRHCTLNPIRSLTARDQPPTRHATAPTARAASTARKAAAKLYGRLSGPAAMPACPRPNRPPRRLTQHHRHPPHHHHACARGAHRP